MILWQNKFLPSRKQRQAKCCGFIFTATVYSPYLKINFFLAFTFRRHILVFYSPD